MGWKFTKTTFNDLFVRLNADYTILAPKRFVKRGRFSDTDIIDGLVKSPSAELNSLFCPLFHQLMHLRDLHFIDKFIHNPLPVLRQKPDTDPAVGTDVSWDRYNFIGDVFGFQDFFGFHHLAHRLKNGNEI